MTLRENQETILAAHFPLARDARTNEIILKEIQSDDVQRNREAVPEAGRMKTSHTSEDRQNQGTIPVPTFATKPLTTSSTISVELPQNHMVGQQIQQNSELQNDKFPTPQEFLVWKIQIQKLSDCQF